MITLHPQTAQWLVAGLSALVLLISLLRFRQDVGDRGEGLLIVRSSASQPANLRAVVSRILLIKKLEFFGAIATAFVILLAHISASTFGVPSGAQFFAIVNWTIFAYLAGFVLLLIMRIPLKKETRDLVMTPAGENNSGAQIDHVPSPGPGPGNATFALDTTDFWHQQVRKFIERKSMI